MSKRRPDELGAAGCEEIWRFLERFSARRRDDFDRALASQDGVLLFRDPADGSVRGLLAYRRFRVPAGDERASVVYFHWAVMDPAWRRGNTMQRGYFRVMAGEWLRCPWRPLYLVFGATTFHSYRHLARNTGEFWPRRDTPWPAREAAVRDAAMAIIGEPGWNAQTGVVERHGEVRFYEGDTGGAATSDPDVAFYAEANPHHPRGDMLITLTKFSPRNLVTFAEKVARRRVRGRSAAVEAPRPTPAGAPGTPPRAEATSARDGMSEARLAIRKAIGDAELRFLNQTDPVRDVLTLLAIPSIVLGLAAALARLPFGPVWAVLFLLQGFALQSMALYWHDAFLHRKLGGETWSWIAGCLLLAPTLNSPTAYQAFHLEHHRHLGTDRDTEGWKQRADTPLKRLAIATLPGFYLQKSWPYPDDALTPTMRRRLGIERRLLLVWAACWVLGLALAPGFVGWGLALPLVLALPIASFFRILLEHTESDVAHNPFHVAVGYRMPWWMRTLLLCGGGDGHAVHHLYPHVPWYKTARAARQIQPVLAAHGVPERTLWQILVGYVVRARPHRARWPDP